MPERGSNACSASLDVSDDTDDLRSTREHIEWKSHIFVTVYTDVSYRSNKPILLKPYPFLVSYEADDAALPPLAHLPDIVLHKTCCYDAGIVKEFTVTVTTRSKHLLALTLVEIYMVLVYTLEERPITHCLYHWKFKYQHSYLSINGNVSYAISCELLFKSLFALVMTQNLDKIIK